MRSCAIRAILSRRLGRAHVTPALVLLFQLLVKACEDFMLETALLAGVQPEKLALFHAQPRGDEESERAGSVFFEAADRSSERPAIETLG